LSYKNAQTKYDDLRFTLVDIFCDWKELSKAKFFTVESMTSVEVSISCK